LIIYANATAMHMQACSTGQSKLHCSKLDSRC